jgi:hypothetical protein
MGGFAMRHAARYRHRTCKAIAVATVLAVTALTVSNGPASAQHGGGSPMMGAQNRLAHAKDRNAPLLKPRHQGLLSAFPAVIADPYWGSYSPDVAPDDGRTCGDTSILCEHSGRPRWDDNNHSSAFEQRAYVAEQPSAKIIAVPAREDSEHHRAWLQRCEPRLAFDDYGVQRYQYNGKRGCEFGQWSD